MGKQYLNGVLYGTGEIIKFSPYIYSLEEREIGVWTDGKPLYQKTITGLSFYTSVSNWASTGATLTDVDRVVMCEIGQSFSSLIEICFARVENDILKVWTTNNETYEFNIVNIQYTKTTDAPGSGKWTTMGVPAVHYDDTERIIGTWFGETLYEKTVVRNNIEMGNHDGVKTEIAHGISNFGNLVALHMSCPYLGVATSDVLHSATDVTKMSAFRVNSTNIYCVDGEVYYGASSERYWYITIQYTKVTT